MYEDLRLKLSWIIERVKKKVEKMLTNLDLFIDVGIFEKYDFYNKCLNTKLTI